MLHRPVDPWLLKARVESSLARKQQRDQQGEALRRLMPGAPAEATRLPDACVLAAQFNRERAVAQQAPVCFGIGLACGAVVLGLASTRQRAAYACIGSPVLRAEQTRPSARRGAIPS